MDMLESCRISLHQGRQGCQQSIVITGQSRWLLTNGVLCLIQHALDMWIANPFPVCSAFCMHKHMMKCSMNADCMSRTYHEVHLRWLWLQSEFSNMLYPACSNRTARHIVQSACNLLGSVCYLHVSYLLKSVRNLHTSYHANRVLVTDQS